MLLATGSVPNKFGWPGQDLDGVQGLYDLMDLRRLVDTVARTRRAIIVGGGLIGIELGEMLHSRHIPVTFLVREKSYWDNVLPAEESAIVNRLIRRQGLDLRLETELTEIADDGTGRACSVVTSAGDRIECELVGLTAGVRPNTDLAKASKIPTGRGVLVDWSLRTSVDGVYAAGDCAELVAREAGAGNRVQQVWYTGKMQGNVVGDVISGRDRTYDPGTWYNSAKFFDLEYQTYGRVNQGVDGESSLYWEDADGEHAFRIVHVDGRVIGFNMIGLRCRHRVCERWIREERTVQHVLDHLDEMNFDPEFFGRHESAIRSAFQEQPA